MQAKYMNDAQEVIERIGCMDGDLLRHGTAKGGPDGEPEDADLGGLEATEQSSLCHFGRGAVASCHVGVEPDRSNPAFNLGFQVKRTLVSLMA